MKYIKAYITKTHAYLNPSLHKHIVAFLEPFHCRDLSKLNKEC